LIIISHGWPGTPLVVAANRDEHLERPAETLAWRRLPGVNEPVLAPRDVRAGGTWLGINGAGLFVGITNRHYADRAVDLGLRSRGELVAQALASRDVDEALAWSRTLDPSAYNGFHLVFATPDGRAGLAWPREGRMQVQPLTRGVHVATERDPGVEGGASMPTDRPRRVQALLAPLLAAEVFPGVDRFEGLLAQHDTEDPMEAPCVRLPGRPYGTRSGMVLVRGQADWLRWTDQAPCAEAGRFDERSSLLAGPA
jgi:uncharacterized protein with NRDE domain